MKIYEIMNAGASVALYGDRESADGRMATQPSTAGIRERELNGTIRVCILERDAELDNVVVGLWVEDKAEQELKKYFADRFKTCYANNDTYADYLEIEDGEEYASRMTARLLTKQETEDLNDTDTYYRFSIIRMHL